MCPPNPHLCLLCGYCVSIPSHGMGATRVVWSYGWKCARWVVMVPSYGDGWRFVLQWELRVGPFASCMRGIQPSMFAYEILAGGLSCGSCWP